jgi:hypothetical protein
MKYPGQYYGDTLMFNFVSFSEILQLAGKPKADVFNVENLVL